MWIAACALLTALIAWVLIAPFFEPALNQPVLPEIDSSVTALLDAKERAVRAVKDLESDFSMGKINAQDFELARRNLTKEVAVILQKIKSV